MRSRRKIVLACVRNFGLSSSARTVVRAKGEDWSVPERYAAAPVLDACAHRLLRRRP
jgi:hypothetical protein